MDSHIAQNEASYVIAPQITVTHRVQLVSILHQMVRKMEAGQLLTKQGNRYSHGTCQTYHLAKRFVLLFEKEYGKVYMDELNRFWVERFLCFLVQSNISKNTAHMICSKLKRILIKCHEHGWCTYNGAGLYIAHETTTAVFNTIEEIETLCKLALPFGLKRVRDLYVMDCFLGLRFSDLVNLFSNINSHFFEWEGKPFFRIKTYKTGKEVVIPINRYVKNILAEYNGHFGALFSYQYFNLSIKKNGEAAAFNEVIVVSKTISGERRDAYVYK